MLALHQAAKDGDLAAVEALIATKKRGLNQAYRRRTALYHAAARGHTEIVVALLEAGASPNAGPFSPLRAAIDAGDHESIAALIEYGADLDEPESTCSPVESAVRSLDSTSVSMLLDAGSSVDGNGMGEYPIVAAVLCGNPDCVAAIMLHDPDLGSEVLTHLAGEIGDLGLDLGEAEGLLGALLSGDPAAVDAALDGGEEATAEIMAALAEAVAAEE